MDAIAFPAAPARVPPDLTRPSAAYRLRTVAVLAALIAFLLFYLALIGVVLYAIIWWAGNPPSLPKGRGAALVIVAYVGVFVALGMLLVFLVKGLFKSQHTNRQRYVRVTRKEQPVLFGFIDKVCQETGAPRPQGVYLSPDVNAAVFYDSSLINLVVPPRKYLLIGAGLVNAVGLREFKAVLAHEFGHFSQQKTTMLEQYVYVAYRVLDDMVYGRDRWDDLLRYWCALDLRVSFPAWGLRGVVWVLRKCMGGVFYGISLISLSLRRQMEFNADDVAVSVAGSDAIVHSLYRVRFAEHCFELTAKELSDAADHGLYTRDVFYHLTQAAAYLRAQANDPNLGVPPPPPARVFDPDKAEDGPPVMWSTHPPNHERERNAKRYYLKAPADDRFPWILFHNADALREKLTVAFYADFLNKRVKGKLTAPQQVQAFIEAERTETTYDPKYHGLFDDRPLEIEDLEHLPEEPTVAHLPAFFASYPPRDLAQRMADYRRRREEARILEGLKSGELELKGKTLPFRGHQVTLQEVPACLKKVERELAADRKQFAAWDRAMYAAHYRAAQILDPARAQDLRRRYAFQLRVQHWILQLAGYQDHLEQLIEKASKSEELDSEDFQALAEAFTEATEVLLRCHSEAGELCCPEMSNVQEGQKLSSILVDPQWSPPCFESKDKIKGAQVQALLVGYHSTLQRLRRIYFKGMGNILARQEQIAADYLSAVKSRPAGEAGSPSVAARNPASR